MSQDLTQATMFLNDLTVVDHAFIDDMGNIIGGSFNPSFLVSGNIDPIEKVVVDFSTVKKQLKNTIDDDDVGFDHKLWFIEDYSAATLSICNHTDDLYNVIISDEIVFKSIPGDTTVMVQTPNALLFVPRNSIKYVFNSDRLTEYTLSNAGVWMQEYLSTVFPELSIVCNNTIHIHTYCDQTPAHYFSYAHGLKDSTSWGCQNIAHGHLSFIQLKGSDAQLAGRLSEIIANDLNCTMFINKANVTENLDNVVTIEYKSHSRGTFIGTFINNDKQKCTVIDTETTIEYLVNYITQTYFKQLVEAGVSEVFVSEGLSKGAHQLIRINY